MSLLDKINTCGYAKENIICSQEQQILLELIEGRHSANMKSIGLQPQSIFSVLDHEIHETLINKKYRFLESRAISKIKELHFYNFLLEELAKTGMSCRAANGVFSDDSEDEEVYYRIVRPFCLSDVGAPHADAWYHQLYGMNRDVNPKLANSYKIWIPIGFENGQAGLSIWPQSNNSDWNYEIYKKNNTGRVPCISDQYQDQMKLEPIPVNAGDLLIFPAGTIHCGMVNYGQSLGYLWR